MPETVFGLPLHPVIVHAVVVLLPLAAIGAIAIAVVPRIRRSYALPVAILTIVAVGLVPIAIMSGNKFRDQREATFTSAEDAAEAALISEHEDRAEQLPVWVIILLVGVLLVVGAHFVSSRQSGNGSVLLRVLHILGIAVSLVGAVATLVMVVRIGHAGSEAVWNDKFALPDTVAVTKY